MKKTGAYISTVILCFIFWLLYIVPFGNGMNKEQIIQEVIVGFIVALLVGFFCYKFFIKENPFWFFNPIRIIKLIIFLPVFLFELLKSNLDVAIRALSPRIKTNSGIVKIKTDLKSNYGITMLANCITLTPGTITLDVEKTKNANYMYIHWIDVKSQNIAEASREISGAFEPRIRRFLK